MARRSTKKPLLESLVSNWIPILTFATGIGLFGFNFASGVANKPYVDSKFLDSMKYTDDKTKYAIEVSIAHSETTRQGMMLKMEEMNSDRQKNEAALQAKVEIILTTLQNMDSRKPHGH